MNEKCPQCGAPRSSNDTVCKYCGEKLTPVQTQEIPVAGNQQQVQSGQPVIIVNNGPQKPSYQTVQPIHISNTYNIGKKKKHVLLWIILIVIGLGVIGGIIGALG